MTVLKILKGPISSGYSFGYTQIATFLEKIGFSSEYIFIVAKDQDACKYKDLF